MKFLELIVNNILYNMDEKKCFAMFCQNCQFFGCTPRLNLDSINSSALVYGECRLTLSSSVFSLSNKWVNELVVFSCISSTK